MRVTSWVTALWLLSACSTETAPSPAIDRDDGGTSSEQDAGDPPAASAGNGSPDDENADAATPIGSGGDHDAGMGTDLPVCDPSALTYEDDVQPLVQKRCVTCHDLGGPSGFDARMLSGLLAGGRHGPAVVPGDCEASLIWQKTSTMPPFGERMPATGDWLSEAERQMICDWIDQGAPESAMPCLEPNDG